MLSRWFNVVVGLFWLTTMGWLILAKVVPSLLVGEPPTYRTIFAGAEQTPEEATVGWNIFWDDQPVGEAASTARRNLDGVMQVESRVDLRQVPLDKLSPFRLGAFINLFKGVPRDLDMSVETLLEIDPLGRLGSFESILKVGTLPEAVRLRGVVEDNQLQLNLSSGGFHYTTRAYLAADSVVSDSMSPHANLPGLRLHQRWTVPVYSPFHPPNHPMEVLHAEVARREPIIWDNKLVNAWLVVYHDDNHAHGAEDQSPRGRVWVHPDGRVLRQDAEMMNGWLRFERMTVAPPPVPSKAAGGIPQEAAAP
ncbi:MAG: hypothetical protein KF708_23140 [Pirellulales bacterium]|nr:hypothetical protein [Pirellulales bacterium]